VVITLWAGICFELGIVGSVLLSLLLLFSINLSPSSQNITFAFAQTDSNRTLAFANSTSCPCVVFRIDDIQDSFVNSAQLEAMNLFISKGQPLSLGIVMKDIGDDLRIVGKVGQGSQMGLFELGLHGWEHVDYTALTEAEQMSTLNEANEKLKMIFGNESDIFVPPFGYFNNETISALEQLGIEILSASIYSEERFDDSQSIFNKTESDIAMNNTELGNTTSIQRGSPRDNEVYHLPGLVQFKDYINGSMVKVPREAILSNVSKNIAEFGYSEIVFHPQDLVQTDKNGMILDGGVLNSTEVQDLSELIDTMLANGIKISTMSEILGIEPRTYSYFK
jgi:peptidoglycan/xylan/chitin deacetylase (PgdA/CDA1 family)